MDTTALRSAYDRFFEAASTPDLGDAADGGWNADQVLAHVLSLDATMAAVASGVVSGARCTFDNRVSLDSWNIERIIAEHSGRAGLLARVRSQAAVLCDIADQLDGAVTTVAVPTFLMSDGELLVDGPIPLGNLIDGLAGNHVPVHTRQLLDLTRRPDPATRPASPGR